MDAFTKISEQHETKDVVYILDFEDEDVDTYWVEIPGVPDTLVVDALIAANVALTAWVTLIPDAYLAGDYSDWVSADTLILGATPTGPAHVFAQSTNLAQARVALKLVISNATNSGTIAIRVDEK